MGRGDLFDRNRKTSVSNLVEAFEKNGRRYRESPGYTIDRGRGRNNNSRKARDTYRVPPSRTRHPNRRVV